MTQQASPFEIWRGGIELATLVTEAQMVMAYRTLGILGLWAVAPGENKRMVTEKVPAFAEAAMAASSAAMAGRRPDEVLGAWMKPLRRKTRSNARRLSRRALTR